MYLNKSRDQVTYPMMIIMMNVTINLEDKIFGTENKEFITKVKNFLCSTWIQIQTLAQMK